MPLPKRYVTLVVVLAAAFAGVLFWTTRSDTASTNGVAPMQGNFSMSQARDFAKFSLYDAGDAVAGYQLNDVNTVMNRNGAQYVSFLYGDCIPPSHKDKNGNTVYDGGCPPPVQVQVWPACFRNPTLYDRSMGSPAGEHVIARGVPALAFEGGNRLEIFTGNATVVIFADKDIMPKVAAALQGVNNSVPTSVDLPAPAAGVIDGTLRCS